MASSLFSSYCVVALRAGAGLWTTITRVNDVTCPTGHKGNANCIFVNSVTFGPENSRFCQAASLGYAGTCSNNLYSCKIRNYRAGTGVPSSIHLTVIVGSRR